MASKYNVRDLHGVARLNTTRLLHIPQVFAWMSKIEYLAVLLRDLPGLEKAVTVEYERARPAEVKAGTMWFPDHRPAVRFCMAVEAAAETVYAVADIAAAVACKATATQRNRLPSSFNRICRAARAGELPAELVEALGDLCWYGRVHELRTEWAHYSAPFVGDLSDRTIRVYSERPRNQQNYFQDEPNLVHIDDFVSWINAAVLTTSHLAGFLLEQVIMPILDQNALITGPEVGSNGFPVFEADGRFRVRQTPVREMLAEIGIPR